MAPSPRGCDRDAIKFYADADRRAGTVKALKTLLHFGGLDDLVEMIALNPTTTMMCCSCSFTIQRGKRQDACSSNPRRDMSPCGSAHHSVTRTPNFVKVRISRSPRSCKPVCTRPFQIVVDVASMQGADTQRSPRRAAEQVPDACRPQRSGNDRDAQPAGRFQKKVGA